MIPCSTIYVYYIGNQLVGFVGLYESYIVGCFIKDIYRYRGIGKDYFKG